MTSIEFTHEAGRLASHASDEKIASAKDALRIAARIGLTVAVSVLIMAGLIALRVWVFWPTSGHIAN